VQRQYRLHAPIYDWTRWIFLLGRRRAVAGLKAEPDSRILEIGCGTGLNFRHVLGELDRESGRLVGLDFSKEMLGKARKRRTAKGWNHVDLVRGDATRMGFQTRFDGILFAYSLTMIPDWRGALRNAFDHLRPGGRLVVLDFGPFTGWGPLGAVLRGWLRHHHVETLRPYEEALRELFLDLTFRRWLGGGYFTATARKVGP
ncbi:MAG: class I SAM-dependent methyltransferase, partial [Planctomycetota bacterium]